MTNPPAADAHRAAWYEDFCARAKGTNVNDRTLLATDYLNHFNEIIMLMELIPDAPECLEDCRAWEPKSYVEHFQSSSIADRDLAIAAYPYSPPEFRNTFDYVVAEMNRLVARRCRRSRRRPPRAIPSAAATSWKCR